jgi:hypothetical protein
MRIRSARTMAVAAPALNVVDVSSSFVLQVAVII